MKRLWFAVGPSSLALSTDKETQCLWIKTGRSTFLWFSCVEFACGVIRDIRHCSAKTKLNWTEWCNMKGRWCWSEDFSFELFNLCESWGFWYLCALFGFSQIKHETSDSRSGFERNQHFWAVSQIRKFHAAGSAGSTVQSGVTELSTILRQGKRVLTDQEKKSFQSMLFSMLMCFIFCLLASGRSSWHKNTVVNLLYSSRKDQTRIQHHIHHYLTTQHNTRQQEYTMKVAGIQNIRHLTGSGFVQKDFGHIEPTKEKLGKTQGCRYSLPLLFWLNV